MLCSDPTTPKSVLDKFFPKEDHPIYAANLMVYPRKATVHQLAFPQELANHSIWTGIPCLNRSPKSLSVWGSAITMERYFGREKPGNLRDLVTKYEGSMISMNDSPNGSSHPEPSAANARQEHAFLQALEILEQARPFAKAKYQTEVIRRATDLFESDEGLHIVRRQSHRFDSAGCFMPAPGNTRIGCYRS
ncbi:MAG: hypothetical protein R3B74_01160 [Nitrospirales bacterium]|nr:hypothetical protein [Nitrospirales bacterium]